MSTAAGAPSNGSNTPVSSPQSKDKGKGKSAVTSPDVSMEEEDEDDDDDEEGDEMSEDEDEEDEEEALTEIDTGAILPTGRRTRGIKIDYSSKEAYEKAGLKQGEDDEDDEMRDA